MPARSADRDGTNSLSSPVSLFLNEFVDFDEAPFYRPDLKKQRWRIRFPRGRLNQDRRKRGPYLIEMSLRSGRSQRASVGDGTCRWNGHGLTQ